MRLVITAGPRTGMVFPLRKRPITIGRDRGATIRVEENRVSRNHATLELQDGAWLLRDLGSTNSTYLNGDPITQAVLKDGDKIRVGSTEIAFVTQELTTVDSSPRAADAQQAVDDAEPVSIAMDLQSLQASLRSTQGSGGNSIQEALYEISVRSRISEDPQDFVAEAGRIIMRHLSAASWAWIEWPDGLEQPFRAEGERDGKPLSVLDLQVSHSLIRKVVDQGIGLVSTDLHAEFDASVTVRRNRITSAIAIPLCDDDTLAVLYLDRTESAPKFERTELERLAILGSKLSMHLANIRLYRQLQSTYEELQQSHKELLRTEKLAAIGRLASGFAHDLNSPLGSILCFLQLGLKALPDPVPEGYPEKIHRYLSRASDAANFCRALSLNLLAFAREKPLSEQEGQALFSVKDVIEGTIHICHSALTRGSASVTVDVEEGLSLDGDPSSLQQLIMNLVTNAADALADTVDTGERRIEVRARSIESGVEVRVADNGPGIPDEVAARIFEPLFTTKGQDRGTGLGLFVVKKIVEDSGGELRFETSSTGTAFTLELPTRLLRLGEDATTANLNAIAEANS